MRIHFSPPHRTPRSEAAVIIFRGFSRLDIDPATLPNVMSPDAVAKLALENLNRGPVLIASEHYQATFDRLLSMPRRDALTAMAARMKP